MANLQEALRAEITRLAKKATKSEFDALRKALAAYRHQNSSLKLELATFKRTLKRLESARRPASSDDELHAGRTQLRFSAKGFAKKRQQLGLSAADMGKLLGVSSLSVYKWESGKTRPRASHLPDIAAVRALGKRAALKRLEKLPD